MIAAEDGWVRHAYVEQVMGIPVSIHVIGHENIPLADCDAAAAEAFAELRDVDALFSTYKPESEVSRIGRGQLALADAHPDVRAVALACADYEVATRGLFSAEWSGRFDPTGYVKGWSVERATRRHLAGLVERDGIAAVGMNAGGDMQVCTDPSSEWLWRVGIVDPAETQTVLAAVELKDGAVATSGMSERGAHVLDPRTGMPARGVLQATVVSNSLTHADVWATTACVAGDDLSWLAAADTRMGLLVSSTGAVRRWSGRVEVVAAAIGGPAEA